MINFESILESAIKEKIMSMSIGEIFLFFSEKKENLSKIKSEKKAEGIQKEKRSRKRRFTTGINEHHNEIIEMIENGIPIVKIVDKINEKYNKTLKPTNLYNYIGRKIKNKNINSEVKTKESNVFNKIDPESTSINFLDISDSLKEHLKFYKMHMISDLIKKHPSELLSIPGFGVKKIQEIESSLADNGLIMNYGKDLKDV